MGELNLTEPIYTFRDTSSLIWMVIGGHDGAPVLGFNYRMDLKNTSHLSAVYLDGVNIGKWESVPWKINVSEPFGIYTYPPPRRTGPPSESSSSPSTGLIVGCVLGGLAVIGVAVFLFIYYSRRMTKQMNEAYSTKQQQQQSLAGSPVAALSEYDTKQKTYDEVHNTNLSPTAAFVPSFQQQINLSSHPRPNVVSTLADQGGAKAEIEEDQGGSKAELEEDSTSLQSLGPPPSFQASSLPPAQVSLPQVPLYSRPPQVQR
jgi:hypothetical protein